MRRQALVLAVAGLALTGCAASGNMADGSGNQQLSVATRMKLASIAEQSGNSQAALSIYAAAAQAKPNDSTTQIAYARALLRSGKIAAARNVLLKAAAHAPSNRAYPRELAVVDTLSGDTSRAIREFDQLLSSDPKDWKTMVDKGVALDLEGRHDAAQALYKEAMPLAHGAPSVATDYAMSLMLQGHFKTATATLEPFFNRYDVPARTRNDLAIAYASSGKPGRTKELVNSSESGKQVDSLAAALVARARPAS